MYDFSLPTFITSLVGSGVTAWIVVKGLSGHLAERWLARYKSDLDKEFEEYRDMLEQKQKRIEAELGHRTYVTKAQFDTEFNAVKDIFAALGKLRLSFNGLRPFVDWTPHVEESGVEALSPKGYQDGAKQHERFTTAYFTAAKLVREHFHQLAQS